MPSSFTGRVGTSRLLASRETHPALGWGPGHGRTPPVPSSWCAVAGSRLLQPYRLLSLCQFRKNVEAKTRTMDDDLGAAETARCGLADKGEQLNCASKREIRPHPMSEVTSEDCSPPTQAPPHFFHAKRKSSSAHTANTRAQAHTSLSPSPSLRPAFVEADRLLLLCLLCSRCTPS